MPNALHRLSPSRLRRRLNAARRLVGARGLAGKMLLWPVAILVGVLTSYAVLGFLYLIRGIEDIVYGAKGADLHSHAATLDWWHIVLVPVIGGLVVGQIVTRLSPSGRARGIDVRGPIPADAVFRRAVGGEFDAVVACSRDQGLVTVNLGAFGQAVNVTLGLPIVRTSVDHGTALDLAGTGRADDPSDAAPGPEGRNGPARAALWYRQRRCGRPSVAARDASLMLNRGNRGRRPLGGRAARADVVRGSGGSE